MGYEAMSEAPKVDDVKQMFLQMDAETAQRALAVYAHELTILARMHFTDGEVDRARECNESLHRVMGYLRMGTQDAMARESFIGMVVDVAQRRGWTHILRQSFAEAAPR